MFNIATFLVVFYIYIYIYIWEVFFFKLWNWIWKSETCLFPSLTDLRVYLIVMRKKLRICSGFSSSISWSRMFSHVGMSSIPSCCIWYCVRTFKIKRRVEQCGVLPATDLHTFYSVDDTSDTWNILPSTSPRQRSPFLARSHVYYIILSQGWSHICLVLSL